MKQIKFRAWTGDEMVQDYMQLKYNKPQEFDGLSMPEYYTPSFSMCTAKAVMQFTGLKDANGVEIYEGDIVAMPGLDASYYESGKYCRGSVEFVNGAFQQVFTHDDGKRFYGELSDIEVCGNIYQNPELLK